MRVAEKLDWKGLMFFDILPSLYRAVSQPNCSVDHVKGGGPKMYLRVHTFGTFTVEAEMG
jgi:hypothetical protein